MWIINISFIHFRIAREKRDYQQYVNTCLGTFPFINVFLLIFLNLYFYVVNKDNEGQIQQIIEKQLKNPDLRKSHNSQIEKFEGGEDKSRSASEERQTLLENQRVVRNLHFKKVLEKNNKILNSRVKRILEKEQEKEVQLQKYEERVKLDHEKIIIFNLKREKSIRKGISRQKRLQKLREDQVLDKHSYNDKLVKFKRIMVSNFIVI